ncbi:MAG: carbohydate-binding domain-containing protein, partial [Bacteroidetes bacterium]|nr:carbohydate-binding domain-containing protein [Bacteroidota bacterium]
MIIFSCAPRNSGIEESNEQGGIVITWKLETNFATEKGGHKAWFKIHNLKDEPLGDSGWELYWNMAPRTVKQETIDGPVTIEWINGDFYRMKPVAGFKLEPDQEIQITYYGLGSMIKESDAPLGLYIVYYDDDGKETRRVAVHDYSIEPFTTPEQINRSKDDKEPIPDPAWRFEQNQNVDLTDENKLLRVIPSPANIELASEVIVLTSDYAVYYSTNLEDEAKLLASDLKELLGEDVEIIKEAEAGPDRILLRVVEEYDPESYVLSISPKGIVIEGGDAAGLFYGTRSLLAMLPVEAYQTPKKKLELNVAIIKDGPAFGYRGFHLDVARNFNSKETVLKLLDVMAFYKLNKLHLHLTEDEAWRIEIEELPELTEIGGFRGHTLDDARYLQPAYGSGPEPDPDNSYGSGYYSREDYKEILRFATARHIEVIPEIN